jgi:hypothetical protein
MTPIRQPVQLVTISGCGVVAWGERDYDEQSATFVKTTFLVLLLVPVLALASYRVARAGRGWFFFGRVPLSATARLFNVLALSALAAVLARAILT